MISPVLLIARQASGTALSIKRVERPRDPAALAAQHRPGAGGGAAVHRLDADALRLDRADEGEGRPARSGPVPSSRNSGGDRARAAARHRQRRARRAGRRPAIGADRRDQQRAIDAVIDLEPAARKARTIGPSVCWPCSILIARAASRHSPQGMSLYATRSAFGRPSSSHPPGLGAQAERDQQRRRHVDRRIGADDDAEDHRRGEAAQHMPAEDQQRDQREQDRSARSSPCAAKSR